ncbi:hypothetical protein Trydic_g21851 [Trypoxylus dichotomus]
MPGVERREEEGPAMGRGAKGWAGTVVRVLSSVEYVPGRSEKRIERTHQHNTQAAGRPTDAVTVHPNTG